MRWIFLFLWSSHSCCLLAAAVPEADRRADALVRAEPPGSAFPAPEQADQGVGRRPGARSTHFEPNMGQVKGRTEWMAQARGASVYITGPEIVFALGNDNAHLKFIGALTAKGTGVDPTGGYSNYFLGN